MKLHVLVLFFIVFSLYGCMSADRANFKTMNMTYFKDYKTDLCFVTIADVSNTLTNVECTEKVEALIINSKQSN